MPYVLLQKDTLLLIPDPREFESFHSRLNVLIHLFMGSHCTGYQ